MSKPVQFPSLYQQVLESKCVDHAIFCNFIHHKYKCFVTIGSTHVEIYNIVQQDNEPNGLLKFDHFLNFNLNEEVIDAVAVRYYGDTLDSIMLSFEEAKVSVLSYDPLSDEVKTIILHNFECETLKHFRSEFFKPPMLRVDPEQRCAVVLVYDKYLGVIPFKRSSDIIGNPLDTEKRKSAIPKTVQLPIKPTDITQHELFSGAGLLASNRTVPNDPSYVTYLNNLTGVKLNYILDMQFLHGYYEPTLLILYEPIGTFVGQALTRKDTCCMITLSLNLQKRTNPIIWHLENLPYDCFKVVPVPRPIGGIIILSTNILIYLNQSQPSCGIALNGFAKKITNFPLRHTTLFKPLTLDCCACQFINSEQLLIVAKTGDLYVVTLILEMAMRTVVGAHIEKHFKTVFPTTVSLLLPNYVFVGSQITDSMFLRFQVKEGNGDVYITSETPDYFMDTGSSIKTITDSDVSNNPKMTTTDNKKTNIRSYIFELADTIKNIGPIGTMSIAENHGFTHNEISDPHQIRLLNELSFVEMVATTGIGEFGSVSLINFTVKPRLYNMFDLSPDFQNMWWVEGESSSTQVTKHASAGRHSIVEGSNSGIDHDGMDGSDGEPVHDELMDSDDLRVNEQKGNYIIMSKRDSTMILEVGGDISELQKSGFQTDEPTVAAGNISSFYCDMTEPNQLIFQVTRNSVRLMRGSNLLEHLRLETDWPILQANSSQNFILLRTEFDIFLIKISPLHSVDGENYGMNGDRTNREEAVIGGNSSKRYMSISKIELKDKSQISSFCLYHDAAGYLYRCFNFQETDDELNDLNEEIQSNSQPEYGQYTNEIDLALYGFSNPTAAASTTKEVEPMIIDGMEIPNDSNDIELYLYGDNSEMTPDNQLNTQQPNIVVQEEIIFNQDLLVDEENSQTWAFLLSSDGLLEIYNVPDFELHFRTVNFFDCPNLLLNCLRLPDLCHLQASYNNHIPNKNENDQKFEIIVRGIGRNKNRPIIIARNSIEVIMYEILPPVPRRSRYISDIGDHVRMKKLPIPCLIRPVKKAREDPKLFDSHKNRSSRTDLMKPFENINGFRGVFIAGSCPVWLFFTKEGHIRVFPMYIEGVLQCFASNPTPNESPEFAYLNMRGELKMMNLPDGYDFEYQKIVRKIELKKMVHFVQYHIESKIYAVISSEIKNVKSIFKLNAENSKEEELIDRDKDFIRAPLNEYTLEFYANTSDGKWETVPNARVTFEEWDKVTCMTTVQLLSHSTYTGNKDFLVVGSNMSYGEEIPVRGKIMIVDIIDVVPEPGQVLTRHKVKTLYDQEQKGPVTAMTSCQGYLVSAIGQKIYIWELKDNELVGIAFVDSEVFIHELHCVRSLILAGDFLKSLQLLRFQSDLRVLSLVSKDHRARGTTCSNFFVDNENLGFIMSDAIGDLIVYSYDPLMNDSRNGKQLVRAADFKLPVVVNSTLRVNDRVRDSLLFSSSAVSLSQELLRQSVYWGSSTGAIYRINPISAKQLTQMKLTEKNLSQCLHHIAGLHPKSSRQYRFSRPELSNSCGSVADGDLLSQYITLPYSQKVEIAIKAGVEQLERILDDLVDINSSTLHF